MTEAATIPAEALTVPINRQSTESLAVQLANGLQAQIQAGELPVGARMPRVREIAGAVGVSYVIASRAVQRLAEAGFLEVRRKTGIYVAAPPEQVWDAHALWVTPSVQSFYFAARQDALLQALAQSNVRVSTLTYAEAKPSEILAQLRATLETTRISSVIAAHPVKGLSQVCKEHNLPLILCRSKGRATADGCVIPGDDQAYDAMVQHCCENGVTLPAILAFHKDQVAAAEKAFARRKLSLQVIPVSEQWNREFEGTGVIEHLGYEAACRLVEKKALPQLLYVTDDYVARGCITGLLQKGVRIPEDLQLIIHGNRKHLPVLGRPLTRIVVDPAEIGRTMAEVTEELLQQDSEKPIKRSIEARFIVGETTEVITG
ncbi:MAG: substrate-binding domain-containing protein [Planctomycetota bacterium]|jgi:DNA-binding LacI/PurR family transcriptional regulator